MDGKKEVYGEVHCPVKRPHFKKRSGKQVTEEFCDKLIGFANINESANDIMFCTNCKTFIQVKHEGSMLELTILKHKINSTKMIGLIHGSS